MSDMQMGILITKSRSQCISTTGNHLTCTTNLNYKHTFDSTGREISFDFDNAYYNNKSNTSLTTEILDANGIENGNDVILKGIIPSDINIYSAKVDYVHPFKNGLKLEAGLKTSFVKTDNQVDYLRNSGSGWYPDDRSNHFIYKENINAAYAILFKNNKEMGTDRRIDGWRIPLQKVTRSKMIRVSNVIIQTCFPMLV